MAYLWSKVLEVIRGGAARGCGDVQPLPAQSFKEGEREREPKRIDIQVLVAVPRPDYVAIRHPVLSTTK